MSRMLDIVTVVANPILWQSRASLARQAIASWLKEPNVRVTLVECAYGARSYELWDLASERVTFVPVRAKTLVWNKESLMNVGIARAPDDARYFGTFDADVIYRQPGWAQAAIDALQLYPVIQPWTTCYDLGPKDELLGMHRSFASVYHAGGPVKPEGDKFWKSHGGPYDYPHSGYAWAWTRDILDALGGLFDVGGMGSADHHMALSLAAAADFSIPGGINGNYRAAVKQWEARATAHVNGKIGFTPCVIEHLFHGIKANRNYVGRWGMFLEHDFDPSTDLKRNSFGVLEFTGNKPRLEQAFDRYLRERNEDVNSI